MPTASNSTPPDVAESIAGLVPKLALVRRAGKSIGFVPTMGALHAGHVSLMERARAECDIVVVSIFVNPTQFGPSEDFNRYPRPRETDLQICGNAGVDYVFYPTAGEIYPPGYRTYVDVEGLSTILEGAIRPGHFRGVATVVTKLFLIVGANRAYFGQKDYQQQLVIRTMTRDLNIPTKVIVCPTLRDPDGLAMSSRNAYLSPAERTTGLAISRSLKLVVQRFQAGERDLELLRTTLSASLANIEGLAVEYALIVDGTTLEDVTSAGQELVALVAARVGKTRLIDNMVLQPDS
ncbi:pantoate--beta-alanine ligase [Schlesneria paludicola]|uniref:pantoate--beta-alanine ligase n=1 Tax=Schlesneria paludicola TaxID=360056 RepID=UPI000299F91A|nr:pantoate--beta-alanine ligase [Schlesneria paludicola]